MTELVPLSRLRPASWNPRLVRDKRFKQLCQSIKADPEFMVERPILATADGTIYAGNLRYRAVEYLKWPVVPARIVDIPEQLAKERAMRDNNAWGEWVEQDLAELLAELKVADSDVELLGFDDKELNRLLDLVGANGDTAAAVQAVPEQYMVIVTCTDEVQQRELLERMTAEGWQCRALLS